MGFSSDTLQDGIAIVTRASQSIGRSIALEFHAVETHVVACSRRPAELEAVANSIRTSGRRALALACDVGDATHVERVVAQTLQTFGRIHILVYKAGYRIRAPLE
jgi:NAD(P)-dependent dehydrogenase (short-subunit alcohol dehydrogenase family)